MERGTRFFEVALAMYDKRKAVIIGSHDAEEYSCEIECLRADGKVGLYGVLDYVDMMSIIRFEDTTTSPGG